jgi:hypothetical protein
MLKKKIEDDAAQQKTAGDSEEQCTTSDAMSPLGNGEDPSCTKEEVSSSLNDDPDPQVFRLNPHAHTIAPPDPAKASTKSLSDSATGGKQHEKDTSPESPDTPRPHSEYEKLLFAGDFW